MLDINPERTRAKILDGRSRPNPPKCAKPVFKTAPPPVKQHIKPIDKVTQAELIEKLKVWRTNNNFTQATVAAKLGISQSFLSDILLLKNKFSPELVERIRDLVQIGVAQSEGQAAKPLNEK
ncbi:MAG: helix-turn-helix domain-containing protein [Magnetococcus sp. YQC-5]